MKSYRRAVYAPPRLPAG